MAKRTWDAHLEASPNGNFGDADMWSGDTLPVSTDSIEFSAGAQSVTTGQADLVAVDVVNFDVTAGYGGDIGDADDPIEIDVTGELRWAANGTGFFLGDFAKVVVTDGDVTLDSRASGAIDLIEARDGTVRIADGAEFGDLIVRDAVVYVGAGCTHTGRAVVHGRGRIESQTSLADPEGTGGTLRLTGSAGATGVTRLAGMVLDMQSDGTIAELHNMKGGQENIIDRAGKAWTVTAYIEYLGAGDGGIKDNPLVTLGSTTVHGLGLPSSD